MRINRTPHLRFFTTLGNEVLRDSRLSFCARGILGHLLSLPDGQRGDIRTLAERTPVEGRERVASALRELERFGYLQRAVKRTPEGRVYTDVEIFDTPRGPETQVTPEDRRPGSGSPNSTPDGDHPDKEREEEPTLPAAASPGDEGAGREGDGAEDSTETTVSTALLARVSRAEPRLSLGRDEAIALAPLIAEWRRRGASDLHIIGTLTAGLPSVVHAPAALVADRLRRKMPAEVPPAREQAECSGCGVPLAVTGRCRSCQTPASGCSGPATDFAQARARGVALARAVLRGNPVSPPRFCPA